jgi:dynein heavy chain 2
LNFYFLSIDSWWVSSCATNLIAPLIEANKTPPSPLIGEDLVRINTLELETLVEKGIVAFARENRTLNIVVIKELMECVSRFDRILTFPSSSMLLVGRSGVGRRSAISIVSILHHALIMTLKVGTKYSIKSFKNDLKSAIQTSAIDGNQVYLVVEDFQMINVIFLDMLNSLLSSGEVMLF